MAQALPWLLTAFALAGVGWVGIRLTAERRPAAPARGAPENVGKADPRWRAVSILTGRQACEAARALGDRRFLPREAPSLPLPGCDRRCECRYRHHADRRSHEDRRNPIDSLGQFGGFSRSDKEDRRSRRERRRQPPGQLE